MKNRNDILKKIKQKEMQELKAERESESWNTGKYKDSSNAKISKIYLKSLRKEIASLYKELEEIIINTFVNYDDLRASETPTPNNHFDPAGVGGNRQGGE